MGKTVLFNYRDFSGGEASVFPLGSMPPKYSSILQNCHISELGGISKNPGYARINTNSCGVTLKGGFEFKKRDGTTIILCAGGGKIFKQNGAALDELKTGLDSSAICRFSQMGDKCIITNGVDAPMKYSGNKWLAFTSGGTYVMAVGDVITGATSSKTATIVSIKVTSGSFAGADAAGDIEISGQSGAFVAENLDVGANPNVATISANSVDVTTLKGSPPAKAFKSHVHKGRVWMIEVTNKLLATYSALDDPEDYTGSGAGYLDFQFLLKKGDALLDVATYIDLIVFLFSDHVAIYSGTDPTDSGDFNLVQLIAGLGPMNTDSIANVLGDMAFVANTGVKSLKQTVSTGAMSSNDISEYNDPALQAVMSASSFTSIFSVGYYKPRGWVLFKIGTYVFVYSLTYKCWGRITGADINAMFNSADGTLYLCGTNYLYRYGNTYGFDGSNVPFKWVTAWLRLNKGGGKAFPTLAEITYRPAATQIELSLMLEYDFMIPPIEQILTTFTSRQVTATAIDSVTDFDAISPFDDVGTFEYERVMLFGGGKSMRMTFENESDDGPIEINGMIIQARTGGL